MVSVKRVRRKHAETIYLRAFIWYNSMENLVCGGVRFMVFSSITFLFVFLAAVLLLSAVCPMRFQNYLLLAASLAFYVWGEWRFAGILVLSTLFDYGMGLLIGYFRKKEQKRAATAALIVTVSGNLLVLGVFKYSGLLVRSINALGASFRVPSFVLPLGISFYTFQQMSYIIDVYRGNVKPQKNPLTFGTYVMLFPQLIAGPIVRYSEIEEQLAERKRTVTGYAEGVRRFVCGLAKKVLLARRSRPTRAGARSFRGLACFCTRFRFIMISPAIRIWQSVSGRCSDSLSPRTSTIRMRRRARLSSGEDGILRCPPGSANMFTSRSAAAGRERGVPSAIF